MQESKKNSYKILVLGPPGSGKSTLAAKLSQVLNIEAIHLDKYYWKPNWVETERTEWENILKQLLSKKSWVMDGNYYFCLDERLQHANYIVYLDVQLWKSLYRIIYRWIKYRKRTRPDMGEGCIEKIDLEFIWWSIKFPFTYKKKLINMISNTGYVTLKSNKDINNWINIIQNN